MNEVIKQPATFMFTERLIQNGGPRMQFPELGGSSIKRRRRSSR